MKKIISVIAAIALTVSVSPALADWTVEGGSVGVAIHGQSGAVASGGYTKTGAWGSGQASLDHATPVGNMSGNVGFDYSAISKGKGYSEAGGAGIGILEGNWYISNSPCGMPGCQ